MTPAVQKALACAKAMATPALRSAEKALCGGSAITPAVRAVDSPFMEKWGSTVMVMIGVAWLAIFLLLTWLHKRRKTERDDVCDDYGETSGPILNPASGGMMLDRHGLDVYGNKYGVGRGSFDD
jgi:hypothetical protein